MRTVGTTPSFGTTTEGTGCPGWLACVASPLVTSRGQPPRKEAMPYNVGIDREEFARLWSYKKNVSKIVNQVLKQKMYSLYLLRP